jgi:hypothetical protein
MIGFRKSVKIRLRANECEERLKKTTSVMAVERPEEVAGAADGPTSTYTEIWSPVSLLYPAQRAIIEGYEAHLNRDIFLLAAIRACIARCSLP